MGNGTRTCRWPRATGGGGRKANGGAGRAGGAPDFARAGGGPRADNTEPIFLGCQTKSAPGLAPSLENFEREEEECG